MDLGGSGGFVVGVGLGGTAGLLIVLLGLPGIRGIGLCGGVVL